MTSVHPSWAASARYQALLKVSESIASHRDLPALFREVAENLPQLLTFDALWLVLHEPATNRMRLHVLEGAVLSKEYIVRWPLTRPLEESPSALVWESQVALVIPNLDEDTRYRNAFDLLRENHVRSCALVPLTTAHRRLGAIGFGSQRLNAYSGEDLEFVNMVARQIAVAVDNALSHEEANRLQVELSTERDRLWLLLDLNNSVSGNLNLREVLRAIAANVRRTMHCDYASVALPEPTGDGVRVYARTFSEKREPLEEEVVLPRNGTPLGVVLESCKPLVLDTEDIARLDPAINPALEGLHSACFLPLVARGRLIGTLNVGRLPDRGFSPEDVEFLRQVANQVAIAVENALDYHEVSESRERLVEERIYLNEEIRTEYQFEEIVGSSPALKEVIRQVEIVAPTDSTVLILGETGTGKELIARAIHNLSARREHTFVKVNCAAIPLGLLESELFGHEKGAFTGAIARRLGRFEVADQGTLFLDEVGDIPSELQPKLLRVLQEQEFERLGSTRTIRVNVRMVAATSRDLSQMVESREFRGDLFYRLNIFPIRIPPLRERVDDIPMLVEYFTARYSERIGRKVDHVDRRTMELLTSYQWPGNIRELQNIVERGVILASDGVLRVDPSAFGAINKPAVPRNADVFESRERELIEGALAESKGRVAGPHGAAAMLRVPASTLESKIRALKIDKYKFRSM